jgi:hypothetical protein
VKFGVISLRDDRPDPLTGRLRSALEHHREILDLARKAEELGFDSFHVGEHHGCDYITSTPSVILGATSMRRARSCPGSIRASCDRPVHGQVMLFLSTLAARSSWTGGTPPNEAASP